MPPRHDTHTRVRTYGRQFRASSNRLPLFILFRTSRRPLAFSVLVLFVRPPMPMMPMHFIALLRKRKSIAIDITRIPCFLATRRSPGRNRRRRETHLKRAEPAGLGWLASAETKERTPSRVGRMDRVDAADECSNDLPSHRDERRWLRDDARRVRHSRSLLHVELLLLLCSSDIYL